MDEQTNAAYRASIAAELRAERARKNITVAKLAEQVGLSSRGLLNYLNAKRDIPMTTFLKVCDVLNTDPKLLFTRACDSLEDFDS